jgi:hypothetical protein
MEKIQKTINTKKFKHIMFCAAVIIVIGWVIFRFAAVASENARYVFNASRVAADVGAPVQVVEISQTDGVLYEPIAVRNNRAYVAGANVNKFEAGQQVGEGKIASVSSDLDLDTGMFVVRTRGVKDGLHYAEYTDNGFFIPLYRRKAHAFPNEGMACAWGCFARRALRGIGAFDCGFFVFENGNHAFCFDGDVRNCIRVSFVAYISCKHGSDLWREYAHRRYDDLRFSEARHGDFLY